MFSIGCEDHDVPSYRHVVQQQPKALVEALLLDHSDPLEWRIVNDLLLQLNVATSQSIYSNEDDPMGRLFVGKLLSRNPPHSVLTTALSVFPDCLSHNPAAYFMACRYTCPETIAHMMRHVLNRVNDNSNKNNDTTTNTNNHHITNDECPYPWIFSNHMSIEGTKAILEVYPQGVLQPSSFLSSYSPLDYFLMSPDMIEQQDFDLTLWSKFKLMLIAAQCCDTDSNDPSHHASGISPVHTLLKRVLSRPDFLDNMDAAQHCLWLIHQLRWTDQWVFEKQHIDGSFPLHFVLSHKCTTDPKGLVAARELTKILLEAHPQSANHLTNGRLALHLAVENGWPCHDMLLALCPEAIDIPDPKTDRFAFQAAAEESSSISLDISFELLRANPTNALRISEDLARVGARA